MPFSLPKNLNPRKIDNLSSLQRVLSLSLVILFIVLISWLVNTSKISAFYSAILPRNQAYTELAFNNINNLPIQIPTDTYINFSFTIGNSEGKTVTYPFDISIGKGMNIKDGRVTLGPNAHVVINENLSVQQSSQRQELVVTLPNQKQSIDLWLKGTR